MSNQVKQLSEDYFAARQGITETIKSGLSNDTFAATALVSGAAMALAAIAGSAMGMQEEARILAQQGFSALSEFRSNDIPFPVDAKSFGYMVNHVAENGLNSTKAGVMTALLGSSVAAACAAGAMATKAVLGIDRTNPSNEEMLGHANSLLANSKSKDLNLAQAVAEYKQMGFLEKIKAEQDIPGIGKLEKMFDARVNYLVKNPEESQGLDQQEIIKRGMTELDNMSWLHNKVNSDLLDQEYEKPEINL